MALGGAERCASQLFSAMLPAGLTRFSLKSLDWAARSLRLLPQQPASAITGQRGEEEAYFYLRKLGYTIIARNWRSPRRRGEIDLIGLDGNVLCFIEVKTRGSRAVKPAEAAVDADKQFELAATAREYLRRYPGNPQVRFDVISIYIEPGGASPDITLFKNAFAVS